MRIPFRLRVALLVIASTLCGVVASAAAQDTQVNSGWRDGRSLAPVVYTAAAVPYGPGQAISTGAVAPIVAQQTFDPYATQTGQAGSFVHAAALPVNTQVYNPPVYQVAQVPQQLPQVAPVYIPQNNMVAPVAQPVGAWGGTTVPYGYGYGYNNFSQNMWTIQLNALYMKRGKPGSFPLLVDGGGTTIVNADQLTFDYKWGFDVGISRRINANQNVELKYFQVRDWESTFSSPFAVGDALATSPPTPLFAVGTVDYLYNSSLNNFELNWITRTGAPRFRVGVGFRWIEISDNLLQTFSPVGSTMLIDTNNHLYGGQIMADYSLFTSGRFNAVPWIKAGIYGNWSDQTTTFTAPSIFNSAKGSNASFVGEFGVMGEFQIGPRFSLVGGYQALYLTGITLAADQLPNMGPGLGGFVPITLDQSDLWYHGAIFGFDIHW